MTTKLYVTLSEVLQVVREPLKESLLWALLHLAGSAMQTAIKAAGPGLLVTPESVLLYPGGRLEVLPGMYDGAESEFSAPEMTLDHEVNVEKMYVYSLGATVSVAMERRALEEPSSSHLHQMLANMVAREPSQRPSLERVVSAGAQHAVQGGATEVNDLVMHVLGTDDDSSSEEEDIIEENLDDELQAVMNAEAYQGTFFSRKRCASNLSLSSHGSGPSYSNRPLQRSASSRSVGATSLGGLSTSSMPPAYYFSVKEGLDDDSAYVGTDQSHSLHKPLSLSLHFQDIGLLVSKARIQSRQLPPDPTASLKLPNSNLRRAASLSGCTPSFSHTYSGGQPAHRMLEPELIGENAPPLSSPRSPLPSRPSSPPHSPPPSPSPPRSLPPSPPSSPPHSPPPSPPSSPPHSPPPSPSPPRSLPPSPSPSPPRSLPPSPPSSPQPSPPPSPPSSLLHSLPHPIEEKVVSVVDEMAFDLAGKLGRQLDKQQIENDMVCPEGVSSPLVTAFQSELLLEGFPSLSPHAIPAVPTFHCVPDSNIQKTTVEDRQKSDTSASFDYSDIENCHFNQPPSTSGEEEFEFPPPLTTSTVKSDDEVTPETRPTLALNRVHQVSETQLETHRALDEALKHLDNDWEQTRGGEREGDVDPNHLYAKVDKRKTVGGEQDMDEVRVLYATVDKSKKTRRLGKATQKEEDGTTEADVAEEGKTPFEMEESNRPADLSEGVRPPLPLPFNNKTSATSERQLSGIYEEVESHCVQIAFVDNSGYTEVGGVREGGSGPGYEVGYSGTGSLHKLRSMLGPEFSTMTGVDTRSNDVSGSLPDGRRTVEVVMLNGKEVKFAVGRFATVSELFEQVVSYQSLKETHVFGLAVRRDRDDIFLDAGCKLAKYAPPGWALSTQHTIFTVFFRVKYYVENVSQLLQPLTRHLYYLQLRKDLLEGKMFCHEEHALQLAALALQAERGGCSTRPANLAPYFRVKDYVPVPVLEKLSGQYLDNLLISMHKERCGLSQQEAELEFLKEAQKLPEYGMLFYKVAKTKYGEMGSVWLGFCVRGLVVFDVHRDVKTATQHCAWRKIMSISFAHRKFVIELQDRPYPLVFYTKTHKRARYLLELSKACHRFHLVWAKKTHGTAQDKGATAALMPSDTTEQQTTPPEAIVEYPSLFRPSPIVEDMASTSLTPSPPRLHPPPVTMKTVNVTLSRGAADSFGFSIAGSSHSEEVFVLKVAATGASEGLLLMGDRIIAVNDQAVDSYKQTQTLLKSCGSQLTMDVQRKATPTEVLPAGECVPVEVDKEGGVLGVRIAGGSDRPYGRGFIRIKQLTADTAASRSGTLQEGDIILQVNAVSLRGMTHRQAVDTVLHAGEHVSLQLHRPYDTYWWRTSSDHSLSELPEETTHTSPPQSPSLPPESPPLPPSPTIEQKLSPTSQEHSPISEEDSESLSHQLPQLPELSSFLESFYSSSEPHLAAVMAEASISDSRSEPNLLELTRETSNQVFDITLRKGYRGFGFRLDKTKSEKEGCGVFILAIDGDPVKSSSMLHPGDEVVGVNGKSLLNLTHQECLQALRSVRGDCTLTIRRNDSEPATDPHQQPNSSLPKGPVDDGHDMHSKSPLPHSPPPDEGKMDDLWSSDAHPLPSSPPPLSSSDPPPPLPSPPPPAPLPSSPPPTFLLHASSGSRISE